MNPPSGGESTGESWSPRSQRDPFEFTRAEIAKSEAKALQVIAHKTSKVGILAASVANHVRDLSRNPADPGWVKVSLDAEEAARKKAMADERAAREQTAELLAADHKAANLLIVHRVVDLEIALGEEGWVKKAFAAQNKKLNGILVAVGLSALGLIGNLLLKLADTLATKGAP